MSYQTKEDEIVFNQLLEKDAECKKCFECGYAYPQWCDYAHGIMVCLECSGKYRGLGTHLTQMRSSTMDGWSNWKPEKLKQMQLGGNKKARLFFQQQNISDLPLKAKYEHPKAQMYRARLEAQALGQPFDEANYQAQDFTPRPAAVASRSGGAAGGNRYGGMGSQQAQGGSSSSGGGAEWMDALSSGWNTVASKTTEAAKSAGKTLGDTATSVSKSVEDTDFSSKANETAATVSEGASKAWGAMAYWATSVASAAKKTLNEASSAGSGGDGGDEDGLGALTRNVEKGDGPQAGGEKYGHVEHVAEEEPSSTAGGEVDGLRGLTANLQRGECKYEGLGSTSSSPPQQQQSRAKTNDGLEALFDGRSSSGSPATAATSPSPPQKKVTPLKKKVTSPVQQQSPSVVSPLGSSSPVASVPTAKPAPTSSTAATKKQNDDDDWGDAEW